MDYLDYLQDHEYDELPDRIKAEIDREAYNERRQLTQLLEEPAAELPQGLQSAFLARTRDAKPVEKSRLRWLPWLAAAGWLLFLGVSSVLLLRQPETRVVEKTVFAPAAPPQIVRVTDTLYQTVIRYRASTVYDTVYQPVPFEQLVVLRDTVYLAEPPVILAKGSSSLSGKERVLDFLFSTE
jgi:hypothetical protein